MTVGVRKVLVAFALFVGLMISARGVSATSEGLYLRVVDAGPGLCTVGVVEDEHYFIYDTGHWDWDEVCYEAVKELIPSTSAIDLIVLSHRDGDHIAATDEILAKYRVDTLLRTGNRAFFPAKVWREAQKAISEAKSKGTLRREWNLYRFPSKQVDPGYAMNVGQARVIFVTGFHTPPDTWKSLDLDQGWQANAGSIVARVDYGGKSILLTGDAVGRRKSSVDASECLATEKLMVDNADDVSIRADVIVAPHHGANNASSTCLIQAVQPGWVIFSAGHDHQHPTEAAGERYLDAGVSETNIFRTDRGDYESGFYHWQDGTTGMVDLPRDDDVEVFISPSGDVCVQYRGSGQCP